MYSIQPYVIKFASEVWQFGGLLWVSFTNKTDRHDITEILLKVTLSTITLTLNTGRAFTCKVIISYASFLHDCNAYSH